MNGTSKRTGNPYNFNILHYLDHNNPHVEGASCESVNYAPELYALAHIEVGKEYEIEFNRRGYVESIIPVTSTPK